MKKFILVATLVLTSGAARAVGGSEGTGGGDGCEERIQEIRDDIYSWIQKGGSNGLQRLPVSPNEYSQRMSAYLSTHRMSNGAIKPVTDIECVHRPVDFQGVEKVCRFDRLSSGPKITCYSKAFLDKNTMGADEQYRLIHHEYAGLAGLEVPAGSRSNYVYSNQLSAFLENQVVKRLAVRPVVQQASQIVDYPAIYFSQLPAGSKIVFTKPITFNSGENELRLGSFKDKKTEGLMCDPEGGGCSSYEYEPSLYCGIEIEPSNEVRSLDLGFEGYRAFDFKLDVTRFDAIILMEEGRELMKISCDNRNVRNASKIYADFFKSAGIKVILAKPRRL